MQDPPPRARPSIFGKTDKFRQVKLSVIYTQKDDITMYVYLINKTFNEEAYKAQEMTKEGKSYTIELLLRENCIYKYYYEALDNKTQKKDTELQCRNFQFAETEKIQVDQWNKVWCLYRIHPKTSEIFQAYEIKVKNCQNGECFELKKSAIKFAAKDHQELMNNDMSQKIRQFSLIQKQNGKEDLSSEIQIETINQFKMNNLYVEFDLQLFSKEIKSEIKNYIQNFEINQEQHQTDQTLFFKQQVQQAVQKQEEIHQKEIKNLVSNFEQQKSSLSIRHCQEINNLTMQFDQKIKYLSEQSKKESNQYKEDFNQFQNIASKKINEYIEKLQESQQRIQILELQLIQLRNNKINSIDNNSEFNEQIIITLCDIDQQAPQEDIAQIKQLKDKLQQYEKNVKDLNIQKQVIGQQLEQELTKQDKQKSGFKQKINKYIQEQDICIQNLENTKKELQDYIQKNQILEQTSLQQAERVQKLQKLLEIVKHKNKELQIFKEQYLELLSKYEDQVEQYKQLENQKKMDDMEFEKFKEEKSQQLNLIVSDYQKQIQQYQDENQILIENQKAEYNQQLEIQSKNFENTKKELQEYIQYNQILENTKQILELTSQQKAENNQMLLKQLEIVRERNKELQTYKVQYEELALKYENLIEQVKQEESMKESSQMNMNKLIKKIQLKEKQELENRTKEIVKYYQQSLQNTQAEFDKQTKELMEINNKFEQEQCKITQLKKDFFNEELKLQKELSGFKNSIQC